MPYTQSALQSELSKQREASAGWPWRLMTLSLVILLTVGAVYAGMQFGFENLYLQNALKSADAESVKTSKTVSADDQKQIFNFYSQLSNIDMLLKKQGKATPYLSLIEQNTLKSVIYANMSMDISEQAISIKMDGTAPLYSSIVQQMDLYKKLPNVKGVKLSGARSGAQASDGVLFSIEVILNRQ